MAKYYYWSAFPWYNGLDPHPVLLGALHQMHRRGKTTGGGCALAKRENGSALSSTLLANTPAAKLSRIPATLCDTASTLEGIVAS